jgi:glyoxylate/hydroxypyruvate reductase A
VSINVLYAGRSDMWPTYKPALQDAFDKAGLTVSLTNDPSDPGQFDYVVYAPNGTVSDFTPFTRVKAVLSLWAGVESIVTDQTLTQPLCRMVDAGLTQGMVEYTVGNTLRYHLGVDDHLKQQDGVWRSATMVPPLAQDRNVAVLGTGALGTACAKALAGLDFNTLGWSRRQKEIDGVTSFSGDAGLIEMLSQTDICVVLLPLTEGTKHILNARTLSAAKPGMVIINAGRGPLIDDDALIAKLDSGHIAGATLDVFAVEPLPVDHPYWAHPKVTVTPHIAAETRPATASMAIVENIVLSEAGKPLKNLVDRSSGY